MLNEEELTNLYLLLKSKTDEKNIEIALDIIKSNKVKINLDLYNDFICIIQDVQMDDSLDLSSLKTTTRVNKILHVNRAQSISIDQPKHLALLQYANHFNHIETIHCWSLKLEELPESLQAYKSLFYLNLGNNRIEHLPLWLKDLPIRRLNLFSNRIKKIPTFICELADLEEIQLGANLITELPESIGQMKQLRYLGLTDNKIKKLPTVLRELKGLDVLSLTGNPLEQSQVNDLKAVLSDTSIYF